MGLFDAGARGEGTPAEPRARVLTVPNAITALRLAGIPVFAWLVLGPTAYGPALALLVAIAASDWVDGYIARRFDQASRLGAVLDPLVDRLLIVGALLTLLAAGVVPPALVAVLVTRDVLVVGGALVLFGGLAPMPVNRTGKAATAALFAGITLLLAAAWRDAAAVSALAWALTGVGTMAYYAAGLQYARKAWELRRG